MAAGAKSAAAMEPSSNNEGGGAGARPAPPAPPAATSHGWKARNPAPRPAAGGLDGIAPETGSRSALLAYSRSRFSGWGELRPSSAAESLFSDSGMR